MIKIKCPNCERPMPDNARTCPNCGVDLALIALLAEHASLRRTSIGAEISAPALSVTPKIGEYLIQRQLITEDQLQRALARQQELSARGDHPLLGQTLIELGFVDAGDLDRAINQQIIDLHAALQDSNRTLEQRVSEQTTELRAALERLTELNKLKANIISNVSHELRTPLAHIKGYIELIADGQLGTVSNEQKKALMVVRRGVSRLEQLLDDLIEFSTASREGLILRTSRVRLEQIVPAIIERCRAKAYHAGIQLDFDLPPDLPPVQADPERLSWVLYQLLDNGIKFTPSGGKVMLLAEYRGSLVSISIIDTGIGIDSDRTEEIFEPFHQLDGSASRKYGGTGLGLALVKIILEAHETEIRVRSKVGEGSAFSFSLPSAA
jgi:signal transduction histidine kinase